MKIRTAVASLVVTSSFCCAPTVATDEANSAKAEEMARSATSASPRVISDVFLGYSPLGRDDENAFLVSEWIGVCEYRGFEKRDDISFYNPPLANFHVIRCLSGPSLASDLLVKFRFNDHVGEKMPEGWKFGQDKMPTVKSQWILFIESAVPMFGQPFDTYSGDYGQQEATEKNVAAITAIIESHKNQQNGSKFFGHEAQSVQFQVAPSQAAEAYAGHQDMLRCYIEEGRGPLAGAELQWLLAHSSGIAKSVQTEAEFKLLAQRPNIALMHYNYAVWLKDSGRKALAAVEYEQAAMYEGSNVDYVGQAGQMLMDVGNLTEGYQYLSKAMQMPGGDKYKDSFEACRKKLQEPIREQLKKRHDLAVPGGAPSSKRPIGDDDN